MTTTAPRPLLLPMLLWLALTAAGLAASLGAPTAAMATTAKAAITAELPELKPGDVVFQTTSGGQSGAIMLASNSPYTHMGMVELGADGRPLVIEAVGPVRTIPLAEWIAKGTNQRVTIMRIKGLTPEQAQTAIARAHVYDGRPYDTFFYDTRDQIYCSELVYAAYLEGPGITVGKVEKVRDLQVKNPAAQQLIKARWKAHPLCRAKSASSFQSCYGLILDQTLVTPASIARDAQLELVYTNYDPKPE